MPRDFYINGATMVSVKSRPDSLIGSLTQLGLPQDAIVVTPTFHHKDIKIDAFGGQDGPPPEIQCMLMEAFVTMNLIDVDPVILDECMRLSLANAPAIGQNPVAGARMGNAQTRLSVGNSFIGLNILSPIQGKPYRFRTAYITGNPLQFPLGTEKSVFQITWRAIPYLPDPWNAGLASLGSVIWDNVLDS